jgi:hypothetical protein
MLNISKKIVITLNRKLGWLFTIIAIFMLGLGYLMTRLEIDKALVQPIHIYLGYTYAVLITFHFILSLSTIRFPWKHIWENPKRLVNDWTITRALQRISAWVLLFASLFMVGTGLGWNDLVLWRIVPFTPHVQIDQVITLALVIHIITGLKSAAARNKITLPGGGKGLMIFSFLLIVSTLFIDTSLGKTGIKRDDDIIFPESYIDQNNTKPRRTSKLRLGYQFSGNSRVYEFNPEEVKTLRSDIFKEGYFSVFDVLVHLAKREDIELEYHFDDSMNTYIIDRLDGTRNWWYEIYYDGGWPEANNYRMDHYPWKDGAKLTFYEANAQRLEKIYDGFREEIDRLERNDGKVVIPVVYINGIYDKWQFENVRITPHNLRPDMFQNDAITAIDVILSLGDQGKVDYTLKWYESIGDSRVVKSFWVEDLMGDKSEGRCGFVHEEGSTSRFNFSGNHIHLPADIKVLNSPGYAWWFYICV